MRRLSPSSKRSSSPVSDGPVTRAADSAGLPWAGRHFEHTENSDDDGSAPEKLIEAIRRFQRGELGEAGVVDALRESRLLIPLVAHAGTGAHAEATRASDGSVAPDDAVGAHHGDKTQELSIVTVAGPDGRTVLPAFTSVAAMGHWNPSARPVPIAASRVALAAASESTDLVVLDPTCSTEFVIRRPALWAIAQSQPWVPSYLDADVRAAFVDAAELEPAVLAVQLAAGDAHSRLAGPELIVRLSLADGLDQAALDAVIGRLRGRWADTELISGRVDSLGVQLVSGG